ncbi:hypothetical protein SPBR_06268 [Sporothrix brasiliensis 5110]|uniref:Uncharacterized protein n=1 Tax=Sporothrix brasiliensis 5110 TaxID=1398154 RepID=A0A0C2IZR3_9PEZI|nr:uncharacterized protein SPBR_06268 [Sporothrix brasiliensis 5110]KIH94586.1 hypothetical protein SPBR_06268 [Sporothrix brasiliensis 5110]
MEDDRPAAGLAAMSSRLINRLPFEDDEGLSFVGSKNGLRETGRPLDDVDGAGSRNGDVGLGIDGETARVRKGLLEASSKLIFRRQKATSRFGKAERRL